MATQVVKSGKVELTYDIYPYGDHYFEWYLSNGAESDEFFETVAEAEADVRRRFC